MDNKSKALFDLLQAWEGGAGFALVEACEKHLKLLEGLQEDKKWQEAWEKRWATPRVIFHEPKEVPAGYAVYHVYQKDGSYLGIPFKLKL